MNTTNLPDSAAVKTVKPWFFVPSLYFAEGVPYVIINTVSVILYKRMGIDNASIAAWTSFLYLPWVIKMFWGPFIDMYSTKRLWIVRTQLALAVIFAVIGLTLSGNGFFFMSLAGFITGAFLSATHDIAADGFYMLALKQSDQSFFVGIRSLFYRVAMVFGSGFLVYFAGLLEARTGNVPQSWTMTFFLAGAVFIVLAAYHYRVLPKLDSDTPKARDTSAPSYAEVFSSYFKQDNVIATLAFILLYRLGEAMLVKLVSPFLLDSVAKGGLGLTTAQVGLVYGTVGIGALIAGGIVGGWVISKYGFRKCIWPMIFILHVPDVFFVFMAHTHPGIALAYVLVALEQFGYGIGFTAFTVYLMKVCRGSYKTAHFAISTGIMALGMMLPGFVSGAIQQKVGYFYFFLTVCVCTIPSFLTIPFILKTKGLDEDPA